MRSEYGGQEPPQRVVILGGGPAGVAAAYWLSRPEQQGRYQVTLYTQGWRLGGKCATGRNADQGERIQEHGLHLLMGCYENAFTTLRACYEDWRRLKPDPSSPFQTWTDAFLPQRFISLMERVPGTPNAWQPWNFNFPHLPGEPGDPDSAEPARPAAGDAALIRRMADWLDAHTPADAPFAASVHSALSALREALRGPAQDTLHAQGLLVQAQQSVGQYLVTTSDASALATTTRPAPPASASGTGQAIDAQSSEWLKFAILANLALAVALGYLSDIFGRPGAYETLDAQDFRAWLGSHHATSWALAAAPIRSLYDLAFAARGTEENWTGSIAAGSALRAQLEMVIGYRDAPLWRMAAGTGDTVFTPFYDVLTARGVSIEFFSRITALRPSTTGQLGEIDISVQAVTRDGRPYRPFRRVKDLDCWPDQPDWAQLKNGSQIEKELKAAGVDFESSFCTVSVGPPKTLQAGRDFDLAIAAMPPDALRPMAAALIEASPEWNKALRESASVETLAMQLWMSRDLKGLGWDYGSTIMTAFAEPFDSWGDMSDLIPREQWQGTVPQSIGYFCGRLQLQMHWSDPPEMHALAKATAEAWMTGNLDILWPRIGPNPGADFGILSDYFRANFDLSERYVATPAGENVASRFNPAVPAALQNLYVVGDWTKTRFSGGCFESAVESAMLASRGISGFPPQVKTS